MTFFKCSKQFCKAQNKYRNVCRRTDEILYVIMEKDSYDCGAANE